MVGLVVVVIVGADVGLVVGAYEGVGVGEVWIVMTFRAIDK